LDGVENWMAGFQTFQKTGWWWIYG
jgi:hypothetical protein